MTQQLSRIWLRVAAMLVLGYLVCFASAGVANPLAWDAAVKVILLAWALFWLYVGYDMSVIVWLCEELDDDNLGDA